MRPISIRSTRSRMCILSLLSAVACAAGCNKSKNEAPPPLAVTTTPAPSAAPAASETTAPAAASIPPPVAPGPSPASQPSEPSPAKEREKAVQSAAKGFGECCKALHKQADTAPPNQQGKLKAGAMSCDGIEKLVESGKTSTKDAYTALRAALGGGALPAGCK